MTINPNFPSELDIKPSLNAFARLSDDRFGATAQRRAIETYGIAGRVWEASYAMLAYLDRASSALDFRDDLELDPLPFTEAHRGQAPSSDVLTILELGSGAGLVATRISSYLREGRDAMIITDLPEVCPLLQHNLRGSAVVEVHPLSWGSRQDALSIASSLALSPERHLTHIICSDLHTHQHGLSQVYFPALLAPLLRTLLDLTSEPVTPPPQEPPEVIISYRIRSLAKETPFWAAFGLWFAFSPVLARQKARTADTPDGHGWERFVSAPGQEETFVFVARRRPESRAWDVPESDEDLLGGVGAGGSPGRKADDTFETILLMSLDPMDV
ncbi:hypothetical protein DAEQUDRAFT_751715 [Daedalea quercina L-15889]|uniref:Methyltransferase domain-containing protein n=1 Tax=Daedalea quercina L-15889 TaxID=1314783 RepID=A0A165NWB0_9APHY|nr:hypothetical protein DAEQUDRAFT_751715 [Daedalea quercina L-15889]